MDDVQTAPAGGPGRGVAPHELDASRIQPAPDNGNGLSGYGSPLYRRARDLAIAAALLFKHNVTDRELGILRASWRKARDLDDRLFDLLYDRGAPHKSCADHRYLIAYSSPKGVANLVHARLDDYLPADVVEDVATAAGALAFGATVKIKPLRGKGGRRAA